MPPLLSYNGSRPIWHHHALFTNLLRYTRPPFLRPSDASGKIFVTVHFTFFCGIRTLAPLTLLLHLPQSCSNFTDIPCVPCNILTDCIHVFYPSLWAIAIAVAHPSIHPSNRRIYTRSPSHIQPSIRQTREPHDRSLASTTLFC